MTPKETRNKLLAERLIKNLNRRNIQAVYFPTAAEACQAVNQLIGDGSTVAWGGSMSIRDMGLLDALRARKTLHLLDRELATTPDEVQQVYLESMAADFYLTSANAMSQDGVIVSIDGNGNRVAAITWGPKKVIFVVGMNKVMPTVESALARARGVAAATNAQRFDIDTPCRTTGCCMNCNSPQSICSYIHFLRNSRGGNRHIVVLVGEDLGY